MQQAVYSLVAAEERAGLHLSIGRRLHGARRAERAATSGVEVFQIAHQLNRGRALIEDAAERRALALINLEAGLAAKRSAAYAAALDYLAIGLEITGDDGWERDYSLNLQLQHQM